jgi:enterochelin esterase-like enzyme
MTEGFRRGTGRLLDTYLKSQFLAGNRGVHIYLPASYRTKSRSHYPVLYLHDGQNVFSSAGKDVAFGWGSWELDRTVDALCRERRMQEIITVAVDNSPTRLEEYSGQRNVPGGSSTKTPFENYEDFLVSELKPRMDHEYRTLPEAAHTALMGSSLGGLCSLVIAWNHPEIFGGAASLSGGFTVFHPNFVDDVLMDYHGPPKPFRVYLDSGVVNSGGGDDGRSRTAQVEAELRRIGWSADSLQKFVDEKTLTRTELEESGFPREKWAEAQTSQHNEFYWRRRSWRALTFLFPPQGSS